MEDYIRKLQIGFMDSIPLNKRSHYMACGISVKELISLYPKEKDYLREAQETFDWLEEDKGKIIWYTDKNYPDLQPVERRLPAFLLYKGNFLDKSQKSISIVGTRSVDNDGYQESFKIGLEAGFNKIAVVSGLAEGCDQAASIGAVMAHFSCFGVLGCGLEYDYPKMTEKLKSRIIDEGGALISRFSPNCPPLKYNFPNRNLIIAAMGNATVVIQAPKKSGSLITADLALQMGKEVLVSSAGVGKHWERLGSNELYEEGASCISSLSDYYICDYKAVESNNEKDLRFGNKHYFLRSLI